MIPSLTITVNIAEVSKNFNHAFWSDSSDTLVAVSVSKVLLVTGHPRNETGELVDLENPSKSCKLPTFSRRLAYGFGGFIKSGPIICGGMDVNPNSEIINDCYSLSNDGQLIKTEASLQSKRDLGSAMTTPDGNLWVHGGLIYGSGNFSSSTEQINEKRGWGYRDLPASAPLAGFCSLRINAKAAMIIGGFRGSYGKGIALNFTHYVDLESLTFTKGPKLKTPLQMSGCAVFKHRGTKTVVTVGGQGDLKFHIEMVTLGLGNNSTFVRGQTLEKFSPDSLLATTKGVLTFGGVDFTNGFDESNEILKLRCTDSQDLHTCSLQEYDQKLLVPRRAHITIPMPESYATEQLCVKMAD